jgi:DNA-binding transcriptional LysR family regulator
MPVRTSLAQSFPEIELDPSFNHRITDLVDDGHDLAVRTGELEDRADVMHRRVTCQRMIVCAVPSYLREHG